MLSRKRASKILLVSLTLGVKVESSSITLTAREATVAIAYLWL
jgi:hypothetical protein